MTGWLFAIFNSVPDLKTYLLSGGVLAYADIKINRLYTWDVHESAELGAMGKVF